MSSVIIGYGVVGNNLAKELSDISPDVYDKYKLIDTRKGHYDVAFVCVDTPRTDEDLNDISQVRDALSGTDADIYVIKSTILPGTTDRLKAETGKRIVFSPEYYGATKHNTSEGFFDFTILGGDVSDTAQVQRLLQKCYNGSHRFLHCDTKSAEIVKYMENAWIGYKVSFMHQFKDICDNHGVAYEVVRELFLQDPRCNPSHTFVYGDHWSSHCLDKDIPAIAYSEQAELLINLIDFNNARKAT